MEADRQFHILYPDPRVVTGRTLIGWAHDDLVNEALEKGDENPQIAPPSSCEEAIEILHDTGSVTVGRELV